MDTPQFRTGPRRGGPVPRERAVTVAACQPRVSILVVVVVVLVALCGGLLACCGGQAAAGRASRPCPRTCSACGRRSPPSGPRRRARCATWRWCGTTRSATWAATSRWSLALLDDGGDGVVLTSIHGRSDARTYAKSISGWSCEQQLSPEEEEAVASARP